MYEKRMMIGNLGSDPEIRYTTSGTPVANFSVATTEKWKDQNGNLQEATEWHSIVAWSGLAEICGKILQKGDMVYIEGRTKTTQWVDQDGKTRYKSEVVAKEMKLLKGSKNRDNGDGGYESNNQPPQGKGGNKGGKKKYDSRPNHFPEGTGDDVPF